MWWVWARLYSGDRASRLPGDGRCASVYGAWSSAWSGWWMSLSLPCRPYCWPVAAWGGWLSHRAGLAPVGLSTSPAPPGHVGATTAHTPSSGSLPPDLLQGSRGVFSLWSVFTPLIRPQLSFASAHLFLIFQSCCLLFGLEDVALSVLLSRVCGELSCCLFVGWVSLVGLGAPSLPVSSASFWVFCRLRNSLCWLGQHYF